MRFCLNCGSALPDAPVVVNFGGSQSSGQSNPGTNPYGQSVETQFNKPVFQQPPQNYSMQPPPAKQGGSNKKIFIAVGGVVALFLLLFVAGAAIVGINLWKKKEVVNNSPTPTPTPTASTSPKSSPSKIISVSPTPKPTDSTVTNDSPTTTSNYDNVKVKFQKVWVDYNITEKGDLGMRVHLKFEVSKLKDVDSFVIVYFQKKDDTYLENGTGEYEAKNGRVASIKALKPGFEPTVYQDLDIFMPYDSLNLDPGKYNLKMDIDLTDNDQNYIQHLTYKEFDYDKKD